MAQSVQGYTDIVCTMYGPVEVFVKLETETGTDEQKRDCDECTRCILQLNLNAGGVAAEFLPVHDFVRHRPRIHRLPLAFQVQIFYPSFLSRAPRCSLRAPCALASGKPRNALAN